MSDPKGKGRAIVNEDGEFDVPETTAKDSSLLLRVAASASGLTRNAFASPTGSELKERAATALSNAGKGRPSSQSPGQGSWAESSKLVQPSNHALANGTFRSEQSEAHVKQSENDFSNFLDGIDTFVPSEDIDHVQAGGELTAFDQVWAKSQMTQRPVNRASAPVTVIEQERQDGDEVLALLSRPGRPDEAFEVPKEDEEYHDWGLSKDQIIELRAMTKEMFPNSELHTGIAAENPLNLIPMSDEYDRQGWFEQWNGVLNRYADEVWGGLLPLIKEARNDLDDIRNGESREEQPKALRRLNAILGHLQKQ